MPQAVTHVIIALVVASLIRDFYIKKKNKRRFPLHYVLIAGVAGLLPDIDIIAFWVLNFFGFSLNQVHRTFTHTLFLPLILLALAFVFARYKNAEVGKHHMTSKGIFLMLALGSFIHLLLDATLSGTVVLFYPLSNFSVGLDLVKYLPIQLQDLFFPSLDAVILILWLVYVEARHKISDFI